MINLTDRNFWLNYWESKTGLAFKIPDKFPFMVDLKNLVLQKKPKDLLEIGGFPGYYSVWLKKRMGLNTFLLDYIVHNRILNELEIANGLPEGSIGVIEEDLFNHQVKQKFDMVMSNGLIEHFDDTFQIIQKHIEFLNVGGTAFIALPNFRGLNGWFQKTFDPDNYAKHNIACMDIALLTKVCNDLNLKEVNVKYDGTFTIWLENEKEKPLAVRIFKKALWFPLKVIFKLIPIETKAFSPYIVITAVK